MDRVELVGDEKEEKKVLHGKVDFQVLKMKEEVKQLKTQTQVCTTQMLADFPAVFF